MRLANKLLSLPPFYFLPLSLSSSIHPGRVLMHLSALRPCLPASRTKLYFIFGRLVGSRAHTKVADWETRLAVRYPILTSVISPIAANIMFSSAFRGSPSSAFQFSLSSCVGFFRMQQTDFPFHSAEHHSTYGSCESRRIAGLDHAHQSFLDGFHRQVWCNRLPSGTLPRIGLR